MEDWAEVSMCLYCFKRREVTRERTKGNGPRLHQGRFRLGIRGNFFTERAFRH